MRFFSRFLACAALASLARATTVIPPTFPELVAEADCIVRGAVTAIEVRAVATPRGPAPRTFVTLAVEECLKGTAGMPRFEVGDREILFVQGNGRQFCPLVGFHHGRYRVLTDPATGRDYVARHNRTPLAATADIGLPLLDPARLPAVARPAEAGLAPAAFLAQIRAQQLATHAAPR